MSKGKPPIYEFIYDVPLAELKERILTPYENESPMIVNGRKLNSNEIYRIRVVQTGQPAYDLWQIASQEIEEDFSKTVLVKYSTPVKREMVRSVHDQNKTGKIALRLMDKGLDVTNTLITSRLSAVPEVDAAIERQLGPPPATRDVFVVHGRNDAARRAMFDFLRAIGLHPLEWSEAVRDTDKATPFIAEILDAAFARAHAVVVLMTPDDEVRLREPLRGENDPPYEIELSGQARPNVLVEAGMAMARSEDRTILVELGELRPVSDFAGRHVIRLNGTVQRLQGLAQRLQAAGCPINLNGTDWHTAGDFSAALALAASEKGDTEALQDGAISADSQDLLLSAVAEDNASIGKHMTRDGSLLAIGGRKFRAYREPRSRARWIDALRELVDAGLVEDSTGNDEIFEVTHRGFQVSDKLRDSV